MRDMPNLDLVRSMAVLSVVLEHTLLMVGIDHIGPFEVSSFGVIGVMVFFILTSLVLMWSLERKPHTLDFYIRRFFRIYPLAWVVITTALLLGSPTHGGPNPTTASKLTQVLSQYGLIVPKGQWIVGVMWSLPYEIEMYLLLPMFFFFVRRNMKIWPLLLLWVLVILNVHGAVAKQGHNFAVAIDYFIPGIMAYVGFTRWKPRLPGWLLPLFLGVMWIVAWKGFNFQRSWYFCLVVGLGLPLFHQLKARWVLKPSFYIARYSYGIYLTHQFAILTGFSLLRGKPFWLQLTTELVCVTVFSVTA